MSSSGRAGAETARDPRPAPPLPRFCTRARTHTPILCCVCVSTTAHTQRKREPRGRRPAICGKAVSIVGIFRVLCQDTSTAWTSVHSRLRPALLRVTTRCRAFCPAFPLFNHFLSMLQSESVSRSVATLRDSPGQNPGLGRHSLLQGTSPTQGSNPGLPCCRRILYRLSHQGSPLGCYNAVRGGLKPRPLSSCLIKASQA